MVLIEMAIPPPTASATPSAAEAIGCGPRPESPPSTTAPATASDDDSPRCSRRSTGVSVVEGDPGMSLSTQLTESGPMP